MSKAIISTMTNREKGALLMAIGGQMYVRDLSLGAALDGHSQNAMREYLVQHFDFTEELIEDLLTLTMYEVIATLLDLKAEDTEAALVGL
jgi:hypothetical protein